MGVVASSCHMFTNANQLIGLDRMAFNRQNQFQFTQSSSDVDSWVRLISQEIPLAGWCSCAPVKSGGHLRDHASYRAASSAESLRLSASALLAALHLGFILRGDVDIYALIAGVCSAVACGHGF